jgi:CheY-like chemotaxis protein
MPRKLLLADDSVTIQKVVELILSEGDFEITSVSDGEEALAKLSKVKPDIVLADIDMPKLGGFDLCKKIKADPATKHIPVLLLAGAFEPIDAARIKEVGAVDYLVKPFESQDLISKIESIFGKLDGGGGGGGGEEEPVELGAPQPKSKGKSKAPVEETVFEEQRDSIDVGSMDSGFLDDGKDLGFDDSHLTTRELKDVLSSLGEEGDEAPARSDEAEELEDSDELMAVLAEKSKEEARKADKSASPRQEETVTESDDILSGEGSLNTEELQGVMDGARKEVEKPHEIGATTMMDEDDIQKLLDEASAGEQQDDFKTEALSNIGDEIGEDSGERPGIDALLTEESPEDESMEFEEIDLLDETSGGAGGKPEPVREESRSRRPEPEPPEREDDYEVFQPSAPRSAALGDVLITVSEVNTLIKNVLSRKISHVINDEKIHFLFKAAVTEFLDDNFTEMRTDINGMFDGAINEKIDVLVGKVKVETIINQVISSTIKEVLGNLVNDVFKAARESTERYVKDLMEEQMPSLRVEMQKIVLKAVPEAAERLIKEEIEHIKSDFM